MYIYIYIYGDISFNVYSKGCTLDTQYDMQTMQENLMATEFDEMVQNHIFGVLCQRNILCNHEAMKCMAIQLMFKGATSHIL